jgi:DNA invertase Pin-like site-specific DNA recombinase
VRAVIYIRVSTDQQGESGLGLDAQEAACRACALRMGLEVAYVFQDVLSGSCAHEDRPGLAEALDTLKPGDVLIVGKRDRLARDVFRMAMIEAEVQRKKARVVSAQGEGTDGDNPEDQLMRRIIDAVAEFELSRGRQRTRQALKAKKRRGERMGQIAYGFTAQGNRLVPCGVQRQVILRMQKMRSRGHSLREIAKALNDDRIPSPNAGMRVCSGLWSGESVRGILAANPCPESCGIPL